MNRIQRLRILTQVIIAYLMLAFAWWSVLLFTKNRDAFDAKRELYRHEMLSRREVQNNEEFYASLVYQELSRDYRLQEWMILGEAAVFIISLVGGIYLINKSYRKEVFNARQQRNFLLSITHELKSPLAGIRLSFETLVRHKDKLSPMVIGRVTDSGLNETNRLTHLVEDLLLSAKLDTKYEPNLEPIDLSSLAEEFVERMRGKYPDLHFHFERKGSEFNILADRYGISSVISNLLENAVKYIGEGSEVSVYVCERESDVTLEVRDDGIGIPDTDKAFVFDKFYRVGNEDTRSTKGTGLGLYIVREVIEAHHGSVKIKDNKPKGSVFEVSLPFGESH